MAQILGMDSHVVYAVIIILILIILGIVSFHYFAYKDLISAQEGRLLVEEELQYF